MIFSLDYAFLAQIARTYGLIAYCRLSAGEHAVIESKLEFPKEDLRISTPFLELEVLFWRWHFHWHAVKRFPVCVQALADAVDLATVPDDVYCNVPYVLLLLKLRKRWVATVCYAVTTVRSLASL